MNLALKPREVKRGESAAAISSFPLRLPAPRQAITMGRTLQDKARSGRYKIEQQITQGDRTPHPLIQSKPTLSANTSHDQSTNPRKLKQRKGAS